MIRARLCAASGRSPLTRAAVAGEGVAEVVAAEARPERAAVAVAVAEGAAVAVAKPTAAAADRAGVGGAVRASPCWSPAPR